MRNRVRHDLINPAMEIQGTSTDLNLLVLHWNREAIIAKEKTTKLHFEACEFANLPNPEHVISKRSQFRSIISFTLIKIFFIRSIKCIVILNLLFFI